MTDSPGDVIERARSGDPAALSTLYRALNPMLLRYLGHHAGDAAEDLASEVWMALAPNLPAFEGGLGDLRALMFTIAHRRVVDHHRRAGRQAPTVPLDEGAERPASSDVAQIAVDGLSAARAVELLVAALTPDQAEIVLLRVLGDLDVAQVAAIVGRSPGAVRVAQHRALQRLRGALDPDAVTP